MELPDELLLEICEYLQPARYEHEAYLPELLTLRPSRVAAHDAAAAVKIVLHTCTTCHDDERIICYRAPPGVSLTFGPTAFPPGFRVVLDVDTAPLPLAVAVWDYETLTDMDATAVPLGYV